jgi:hypothetical protein
MQRKEVEGKARVARPASASGCAEFFVPCKIMRLGREASGGKKVLFGNCKVKAIGDCTYINPPPMGESVALSEFP